MNSIPGPILGPGAISTLSWGHFSLISWESYIPVVVDPYSEGFP